MSGATIRRLSRVAASTAASVSGRFASVAHATGPGAASTAMGVAITNRGYRGQASDIAGWKSRGGLHPAISPTPSWSTAELLDPPGSSADSAPIDADKLRKVARQANIAIPDAKDEEDAKDEDDHPLFAAAESPAEGALRGVNEVLRFVQALDKVDVEGFEPMWTVLDDERSSPLRADEVAGRDVSSRTRGKKGDSTDWVLDGVPAEAGVDGWAAADRDELVGLAPDSSRAPFYVAARTSGTPPEE